MARTGRHEQLTTFEAFPHFPMGKIALRALINANVFHRVPVPWKRDDLGFIVVYPRHRPNIDAEPLFGALNGARRSTELPGNR